MASKKKRGAGGKARKKATGKKAARKSASSRTSPARGKASKKAGKKKAGKKRAVARPRGKKKPTGKAGRKPARPGAGRKKKRQTPRSRSKAPARRASKRPKTGARAPRGREFQEHFRQKLLEQRQQITSRLGELRDELAGLEQAPPRELEEWAQEEKDRDILIRLEERETDELRRIQAALALIDAGEYGVCQNCGKPIPRARLEELPTAFRCIDCTP